MKNSDLLIIIAILCAIGCIFYIRHRYHVRKIEEMVASLEGENLSYEYRLPLFGLGPFKVVFRHQTVYYFRYEVDSEEREGWVKFRPYLGPDWRV